MNDTDSKQSAGYFREKAIIFTGDDIDKAIIKVSSHMLKAPKEKYLQTLIAASFGHSRKTEKSGLPVHEYIVLELEKRTHTHNWVVVLKSLVTLHRLLCDSSDVMVESICKLNRNRGIFLTSSIKELRDSASGASQFYFIQAYMRYLEARCTAQEVLGFMRRIETSTFDDYITSLNAEKLLSVVETLLELLASLVAIEYREMIVDNFCTLEAYQLIIRDGKRLFQLLSQRMVYILNGFEDFSLPLKKLWIEKYKRYTMEVAALKQMFDSMTRSYREFSEPIPQLKALPQSLLDELEHAVRLGEESNEVCSLESLGIAKEDKRNLVEEKLPSVPSVTAPPSSTTPAQAEKPKFSMDDLFQPAEPATVQLAPKPQEPLAPATPTPTPTPITDAWSSGVPGGWSTGAPTQPPYSENNNTGYPTYPQTNHFGHPQANTQQPHLTKPEDPFKQLYNQSQNQW